ncbi:(2Fe-2S)-binding protein [Bosea sp. BK604]|uniref:(2Fe-2S)-binding protein n=1 Tax=Bosea sp. BK604 TaxID=2512180 RepID=UPI00104C38F4|nr:(2Fe-2S)-binding protein [Bosea sp. BK604]TCR66397.1 2Fe-2S iron-sulfur cluster protein [Bosea sp. BK604]
MADLAERDATRHRAQLVRAVARDGRAITLTIDGREVAATEDDSVLATILTHGPRLRHLEFGGEPRAGFCLMGACQDCWVWTAQGERLRACTTPVRAGMALLTLPPAFAAPGPFATP